MLMLLFQAGSQRYALDCHQVVEVLPWATLYPPPQAQKTIAGLLNYHGQLVAVIDLGQLIDQAPTRPHFGARIILIPASIVPGFETSQWVGLLADRVVDTRTIDPAKLEPVGIGHSQAPYLGPAIVQAQAMIRCFHPEGIDVGITAGMNHAASVG
jgi:chemotaxis-related protein WspB